MTTRDLAGEWSLSDDSGDYTCAINLPTDGISALHAAGLIPNLYWGRNEYDLRWIAERDWTIKRRFVLTKTEVDLLLSGVDTIVDVEINGQHVMRCENAFRSYRVDLSTAARVGDNTITVSFKFHRSRRETASGTALLSTLSGREQPDYDRGPEPRALRGDRGGCGRAFRPECIHFAVGRAAHSALHASRPIRHINLRAARSA